MICKNCEGAIKEDNYLVCSHCGASLHFDCKYQCIKCGAAMCDECAIKFKFKCKECYNIQQFKMEFISATMFEAYEKCPFSFKHEHILNTFTEEERENKYSATGKLLHSLFDKYSQIRPLNEEVKVLLGSEFKDGFDLINVKLFDSVDDMVDFKTRGYLTLTNWLTEEIERPVPLYTEKEHFFELPGIDTQIRATIDRINGLGDDSSEWEVEDYKTGKVYSADMLRHNFQLPTYALAIQKIYGALPKKLHLRFPQHTDSAGHIQERVFERVSEDIYVCTVRRGGTYSFSLTERLQKMQEIYDKIKRGDFPLNITNTHFCENFCVLNKRQMCDGLSTKWNLANQRGY